MGVDGRWVRISYGSVAWVWCSNVWYGLVCLVCRLGETSVDMSGHGSYGM